MLAYVSDCTLPRLAITLVIEVAYERERVLHTQLAEAKPTKLNLLHYEKTFFFNLTGLTMLSGCVGRLHVRS